jgi:hypothetical protein
MSAWDSGKQARVTRIRKWHGARSDRAMQPTLVEAYGWRLAFGAMEVREHPVPEITRDVFFYGLFMDEDLLRSSGVNPRRPRRAVVPGYRLRIARRARLEPRFGAQAFGMVFALTDREIASLYAEPGLELYRPEALVASFEDGTLAAVTAFNLGEAHAAARPNPDYTAKLRVVFERLGFPTYELRSIE